MKEKLLLLVAEKFTLRQGFFSFLHCPSSKGSGGAEQPRTEPGLQSIQSKGYSIPYSIILHNNSGEICPGELPLIGDSWGICLLLVSNYITCFVYSFFFLFFSTFPLFFLFTLFFLIIKLSSSQGTNSCIFLFSFLLCYTAGHLRLSG